MVGRRGREISRIPWMPAPSSPAALRHLLSISLPAKAQSSPPSLPGTCPPALGIMDLRRPPPGPRALRWFQVRAVEEGVGVVSGLHPLSQAPTEFNSKVQRAFAPSQIKGHSAGEMSWLIKEGRGPLDRQATTAVCPHPRPVNACSPLPPFRPTAPQEKPINLTLIGFSICHNPRRSWGGGEG